MLIVARPPTAQVSPEVQLLRPCASVDAVAKRIRFQVSQDQDGLRLDQGIGAALPEISRTLAKKLIALGGVYLNRRRVKVAGRILREGQQVELHIIEGSQGSQKNTLLQNRELVILERGPDFVVVEKPSGVFSAPTLQSDQGDLLDLLRAQLETLEGNAPPLHLVHRLDRPTSGLMVVATSKAAAAHLGGQLINGRMKRVYQAILVGELSESVELELAIDGKAANTTFTPIQTRGGLTQVEARLGTGRTHQVRIHAESLKMPVAGDSKYGRQLQRGILPRPPRLALHAIQLAFVPPFGTEERLYRSIFPPELSEWFAGAHAQKAGNHQNDC